MIKNEVISTEDLFRSKAFENFAITSILVNYTGDLTPEQEFYIKTIIKKSTRINLYQQYKNRVKDILDEVAIYEAKNDRCYTHLEIIDMVEKTSVGLLAKGYNENSKIGIILNGSIAEVITLLAVSNLGATGEYIDYMKPPEAVRESIDSASLDLLIIEKSDISYLPTINGKGIPTLVANSEESYEDENIFTFASLYKLAENNMHLREQIEKINKSENIGIYSSGTTGAAKIMVHSGTTIYNSAEKVLNLGTTIGPGNATIKIVPSFIGLGIFTSLYTGLLSGGPIILQGGNVALDTNVPELMGKVKETIKNFKHLAEKMNLPKDAKLNLLVSPDFIREIVKDDTILDLSMLGYIMVGGSSIDKKELEELEKELVKKCCHQPICVCYGTNEMGGGASYNTQKNNKNGSVGRVAINTKVIIVDPVTYEPLEQGQEGKILFITDSQCLGYKNDYKKTSKSYVVINGVPYFDPGDYGRIDEEGYLYITGREKRVAIRKDFKAFLDKYENILRNLQGVKNGAVICPTAGGSNEGLVFFVIPTDENVTEESIFAQLQSCDQLADYEQVDINIDRVVFVDKFPFLPSGKKNYLKMREDYLKSQEKDKGSALTLK